MVEQSVGCPLHLKPDAEAELPPSSLRLVGLVAPDSCALLIVEPELGSAPLTCNQTRKSLAENDQTGKPDIAAESSQVCDRGAAVASLLLRSQLPEMGRREVVLPGAAANQP